jgi:hypothetical protein
MDKLYWTKTGVTYHWIATKVAKSGQEFLCKLYLNFLNDLIVTTTEFYGH